MPIGWSLLASQSRSVLLSLSCNIGDDVEVVKINLSLVDQTKIVTAASELARNMLIYGGGGEVTLEVLQEGVRHGLRAHFVDVGPGTPP